VTSEVDISVLLEEFLEDAAGHLEAIETTLLKLEEGVRQGKTDQALLSTLLGSLHTVKGNSGMMGFAPLQQYIHKLESLLKLVADGKVLLAPAVFEAYYGAVNLLRESLAKLAANPTEPLDFGDALMLLKILESNETDGQAVFAEATEKKEEFGYITQRSTTLKVNFTRLDELMNLVGELVIHRTTLQALEKKLQQRGTDRELLLAFKESSQLIGKSAAELREAIMKVRMLPIKVVFQRFNRLVRDLSQSHGKEIRLQFEGEETEIDKTIIDEVGEPLLHLIRNAVDHGFEEPAERTRLGKPAAGTLWLRARHENNHIIIAVEDDGRGMVAEKLKQSAREKGVLSEQELQALTDQEALQLVFLAGFSTKREVSETSGRGIGLDVVKKTVASLNGIMEIDSVPGRGTLFTIKLPLTLAIIAALMVESSGETFAIPLSGVMESIKIDSSAIHTVEGGEIIQLRDRLVPVFRLDRFFNLPRAAVREQEYVVIVGNGEKRGGIIVDRLMGQQEIVIKAMDDYLGELPGVSGGTVRGDGTVSLILDIGSIIGGKSKRGGTDGR